mgnify:CR=1 FL=1
MVLVYINPSLSVFLAIICLIVTCGIGYLLFLLVKREIKTYRDEVANFIDGVETKKETGKLVITDSDKKDYTYEFEMYEILDGNDAFKLLKSLNNVNSMDNDISMYQKICMYEELFENYNTVINNANLDTVSNFEIKQPEDSKTGDKYLVVLSKKSNGEQKNIDIQVLECSAKENKVVTTESIPVKTTSKLPVTGEQIGIYIFLGIILLLIVFVVLRIYFLVKKKDASK